MARMVALHQQGVKAMSGATTSSHLLGSRPAVHAIGRSSSRRTAVATHALLDFLKPKRREPVPPPKPKYETVVLEPAYNLQAALITIAGVEGWQGWTVPAVLTGLLGVFLTIQAQRVKFIFDDEALEIKIYNKESDNVVVGGLNRWPYDTFVNWELWWPAFPVLVYFKENQTKAEGQIHFFPIIFNGKQLYEVMSERCGPSVTTPPAPPKN